MFKIFVTILLVVAAAVLSGCASMDGYQHDSSDYYNQPADHQGHGGHSH